MSCKDKVAWDFVLAESLLGCRICGPLFCFLRIRWTFWLQCVSSRSVLLCCEVGIVVFSYGIGA